MTKLIRNSSTNSFLFFKNFPIFVRTISSFFQTDRTIFKFSAKNWIAYGTFLLGWVCEQNKFWSLGYLDLHQLMTKPLFPSWASPMHSRNLMIYSIMNSQETGEMRRQKNRSNPLFLLLFYKDLHFVHSWQLVFLCCMRSLNKMGSYLAEQKEVIMQKKTVVE